MYIKQVKIEGFKVYKDQLDVTPFMRTHNCVVGANGSGKSNFFLAIQFVLGESGLHNLRADERKALLHEGSGSHVLSAYVEVVFDNTSGRLPLDGKEVTLRRTIGLKKDEYFLDRKHITKTEVMSLLESAGLSRANPYTIVQQGKVARLAVMSEKERLESLLEIAGTRVYDEKRSESQRIMKDTDARRAKIEETLGFINDRMRELDAEKRELAEYQELDRKRRVLEHCYHLRELDRARREVEASDRRREEGMHRVAEEQNKEDEAAAKAVDVEKRLRSAAAARDAARASVDAARGEAERCMGEVAALELVQRQGDADAAAAAEELRAKRDELAQVKAALQDVRAELADHEPQFAKAVEAEAAVEARTKAAEAGLSELYARQAHGSQFASKAERDKHLKKEADSLRKQMRAREAELDKLRKDVAAATKAAERADADAATAREKLANAREEAEGHRTTAALLRKERDEACEARKQLWRRDEDARKGAEAAAEEVQRATSQLASAVSRAQWQALQAVTRLAKQHKVPGVHGMLIELVSCDAKFHTAAEVAASNQLFNVVVDDDATAARMVQLLRQNGGGRATFMPLKQLRSGDLPQYPQTEDAIPLISRLRYDNRFEPAVRQVFRKVLVCRNMTVASKYAASHQLDCVTLDGDTVSRRGALTGGFHDMSRSRMDAQARVRDAQETLARLARDQDAVRGELAAAEQQVSRLLGEVQKAEALGTRAAHSAEQLALDVRATAARGSGGGGPDALEHKCRALAGVEEALAADQVQLEAKQRFLATELASGGLTAAEQARIVELQREQQEAQSEVDVARAARSQLHARKVRLEARLNDDLMRASVSLEADVERLQAAAESARGPERVADLERARAAAARCAEAVTRHEADLEECASDDHRLGEQLEDLRAAAGHAKQAQQDECKQLEKLLMRRNVLATKIDDHTSAVRQLGSVSREAAEAVPANVNARALLEEVDKINGQLKKYSHVNKKALDQYANFAEQREDLLRRKEMVDKGAKAIVDLIAHLDAQKEAALERTFGEVAKHFQNVFKELVPGGWGKLDMRAAEGDRLGSVVDADDIEEAEEEEEEEAGGGSSVHRRSQAWVACKYAGVSIRVRFAGGGDTQSMQQLSGGQKTMVALCIIFAIQRCDPAPFYLFDEIDANLDGQHRQAVAQMVQRQAAKGTQFITTTFRPELVKCADQHYGVSARNRVSTITRISVNQALKIITEEQSVQQQRAS